MVPCSGPNKKKKKKLLSLTVISNDWEVTVPKMGKYQNVLSMFQKTNKQTNKKQKDEPGKAAEHTI